MKTLFYKFMFVFAIIINVRVGLASMEWAALPAQAPVPKDNPMTPEKIELGKLLFFDTRLSANSKLSCNTCHNVLGSGTDNLQFSKGINDQLGGRNSPTVWNSGFWSVQFWDGRAASLEEQAKGPITNPVEMGMKDHNVVVAAVKNVKAYGQLFSKVFGGSDPINIDNIAKAIAAFERTLITPNSPVDKFLNGDKKALTSAAQRGMELVKTVGCNACHSGPHFNGPPMAMGQGFYQRFPLFTDNKYEKKYNFSKDLGRYEVTKDESDKNAFRVMSWRNISETAPYFHNGAVKTLDEAVRVMAKTQLNKDLKNSEVADIVAFLKALKGERPKITAPVQVQ